MYLLELAGEDDAFAAAEARTAASDLAVRGPGLAVADAVALDRAAGLAFTRRVSDALVVAEPDVDALAERLEGLALEREGPVAVRARDVRGTAGVDSLVAERRLGQVLVDRGYAVDLNDPAATLVALFADGVGALGWARLEPDRDFGGPPTDRPFFQPGSMDPQLARAVLNLAGVEAGDRVLDPMCGTGGLLLEAGLLDTVPVGLDAQEKMVRGTRKNLRVALGGSPLVVRGDATALPLPDGAVDAVVLDTPYGRQSKIATHDLEPLVEGALAEAARVGARAVVVADRDYSHFARAAGWTVRARHERRVHRSLTRHVHVLR